MSLFVESCFGDKECPSCLTYLKSLYWKFVSNCSLTVVFMHLCPSFTFLSSYGPSILICLSNSGSLFLFLIPDFAILSQVRSSALTCWFFLFALFLDVCYWSEVLTKQRSFIALAQTYIHVARLCWREVLWSKDCLLRVSFDWWSFSKACNLVWVIWLAEHLHTFLALIVSEQLILW